jgi:2-oxoglutarate dehydrogenase N-terminus
MSAVPPESPRAAADLTEQDSDGSGTGELPGSGRTDFGPNEWLVDELYQRYLADPGSVDMAWWNFFADYQQPRGGAARRPGPTHGVPP